MKYIHLELSNLIGRFERTMVQIYIDVHGSIRIPKFNACPPPEVLFSRNLILGNACQWRH